MKADGNFWIDLLVHDYMAGRIGLADMLERIATGK